MNGFEKMVSERFGEGVYAKRVDVIQVNLGLRCNQSCAHCHLSSSPARGEMMGWSTMEKVLDIIRLTRPLTVDVTGGAPELNPDLVRFIRHIREEGIAVQVRTNLTALGEAGREELAFSFRDHKVMLVGSLPCYLEDNVNAQRGAGVFARSVETIRRLNTLGYGEDPDLPLNLVYNPGGAFLPGDQAGLEADYRRELGSRYGISFTTLLTITNMPLGRFGEELREKNRLEEYLKLLTDNYNPDTVNGLMCRYQTSIGWDGTLYDCDFNLALDLVMNHGAPDHIDRWDLDAVAGRRIVTGRHCFGCTAGAGSSCGGALAES